MTLVKLCLVGAILLGASGCVWDHDRGRGGGDRGPAGYSDQRGGAPMDPRSDRDRYDERRMQENHPPMQDNRQDDHH